MVVLVVGAAGERGAERVAQVRPAAGRGPGKQAAELLGPLQGAGACRVGRAGGPAEPRVQPVPVPAQPAEELDDAGLVAGDVVGELLKQRDGPLAASVVDGVRDVEPLRARVHAGHEVGG